MPCVLIPDEFTMALVVNDLCYQLLALGGAVIFSVLYFFVPNFWFLGVLNIITPALYVLDKLVAISESRSRAPENTLLLLGVLGGWPSAICAQQLFRHKTSKQPFQTWFICSIALNIVFMGYITKDNVL